MFLIALIPEPVQFGLVLVATSFLSRSYFRHPSTSDFPGAKILYSATIVQLLASLTPVYFVYLRDLPVFCRVGLYGLMVNSVFLVLIMATVSYLALQSSSDMRSTIRRYRTFLLGVAAAQIIIAVNYTRAIVLCTV